MVGNSKNTKERILDAAEELFAKNGFQSTSLRQLTAKADVNLAAVHYHFGSKEGLIEEVIKRRLLPLNQLRLERLTAEQKAAQRDNRRPDAAAVLRAFLEPTLSFSRTGPGPIFTAMIGRALNESDDTARVIFMRHIQPLFKLLFSTLCEALPAIPETVLFWRLHFFIGSIIHTMNMHNRGLITPERVDQNLAVEHLTDMLLSYATAGMTTKT